MWDIIGYDISPASGRDQQDARSIRWPDATDLPDTLYVKTIFRMEQCKHLAVYWHDNGYPTDKMNQKLLARTKGTAPAYSTITNWIRALERGEDILRRAPGSGRR
jgi:hypothetical protein